MRRFGSGAWTGSLRERKGSVATESQALESYPYTFCSGYGEMPGTNPEELHGAAPAACFTMSFVRKHGITERRCDDRRLHPLSPADRSHAPLRKSHKRG
jgi:organic hydroperoxide reductase OsmC/OhrA